MSDSRTYKLALFSLLLALALVLSFFENVMLPSALPIPGVKLGLSNIVTLFSLFALGTAPAAVILVMRCIVASFFGGGVTSLFFSLAGGILALFAMVLTKKTKLFSVLGISIAGSSAHSIGQIVAAAVLFGSGVIFTYLPIMLVASLFTGAIIALITNFLLSRTKMYKK